MVTEALISDKNKSSNRVLGLDLARGFAIIGMLIAHIAIEPSNESIFGFVAALMHGRASALFCLLAGVTLIFIVGKKNKTHLFTRELISKIVVRSLILTAIGYLLSTLNTPVVLILEFYGVYFLLALPFCKFRTQSLLILFICSSILFPQIRFLLQSYEIQICSYSKYIYKLFVDRNYYPAMTWISYIFAGMYIAHLDLNDRKNFKLIFIFGVILLILGYGTSYIVLNIINPEYLEKLYALSGSTNANQFWWSDMAGYPNKSDKAWFWVASPHSQTSLSILGNTGAACIILSISLWIEKEVLFLKKIIKPITLAGSMSLTSYALHIILIKIYGFESLPAGTWIGLIEITSVTLIFACIWKYFFTQGPIEFVLSESSKILSRRM